MKKKYRFTVNWLDLVLICALIVITSQARANTMPSSTTGTSAWELVKRDYQNFYTRDRFTRLGIAFGIGAVMANTHIDQGIRDWYQDQIRTPNSDSVSKVFKKLGDGYYMIPVSLLAIGIGHLSANSDQSVIGEWGQRSFRA